jgi:hypothetical protein
VSGFTRVCGRVVDAQGKPIAAAGVKLDLYRHQLGHTITSQGTEWTVGAGGDGRFTTPPLPAGKGRFSFSAPGKVRTFLQKNAEPGTFVVDLGDGIQTPINSPVGAIAQGIRARGPETIRDRASRV